MSDDLFERFDDVEDDTADADEAVQPGPDADPDSTRQTRSQFPMYLSDELQEAVNERFEKFNAHRVLNDEPQVEKHKHFLEGLVRAGLDSDELETFVTDEFEAE